MQLKNKAERERFLENYRAWELWKEIPELELKFYRYAIISTGACIIATEYITTYYDWQTKKYKDRTEVKYHLILLPSDKFYSNSTWRQPGTEHRHFELEGISKSNLVRYLTDIVSMYAGSLLKKQAPEPKKGSKYTLCSGKCDIIQSATKPNIEPYLIEESGK